jgi:exonuclease SbcC
MRLRSIEVENFLSHHMEKLLLPAEGIFVAAGTSGSGKSSLLIDAPGYALFGSNATRVRARKQTALRHRDHPGEPMSVRVLYQFDDGQQLMFARGLDARNSAWAEVYQVKGEESTLLASGSQDVARVVARQIGVDWRQFYASFVCRQDELTLLTRLAGRERKEIVQQMLGMRELDKSAEMVTKKLRTYNQEIKTLSSALGDYDLPDEEEAEKALAARREGLIERLRLDKETLATLQAQKEGLAAQIKERDDLILKLALRREIEARLVVLEKEIKQNEERLVKQDKMIAERKQDPALAKELQKLEKEREKIKEAYLNSRAVESLATQKEESLEAIEALSSAHKCLLGPARSLIEKRASLKASISLQEKESGERQEQLLKMAESKTCSLCLRPLLDETALDHINLHARQRQEIIKSQKEELGLLLDSPLDDYLELESKIAQIDQSLSKLAAGEDSKTLEKSGLTVAKKIEQIQIKRAEINSGVIEPGLLATTTELIKEKELINEQLDGLPTNDLKLPLDNNKLTALLESIGQLQGSLPEMEKEKIQIDHDLQRVAEKNKSAREKALGLAQSQQKALDCELLQTFLQGFVRKLAGDIRPALSEISSQMLAQISGGRHVAMAIDDNYEIEVERQEGNLLPSVLLSGGEQIRANLCLRLALTRLVSQRTGVPFRLLVLDEPLPAQDEGHCDRIMELLESLRPYYAQQFIISHVGDLRSSDEADYVIEFSEGSQANRVSLVHA